MPKRLELEDRAFIRAFIYYVYEHPETWESKEDLRNDITKLFETVNLEVE